MRKPKLTDVELSKVLSLAAIGKLDHRFYGDGPLGLDGYGCVAGTAYDLGNAVAFFDDDVNQDRMSNISRAVHPGSRGVGHDYGGDPDSVLRHLERCGVA
jgi:hypothetical protein